MTHTDRCRRAVLLDKILTVPRPRGVKHKGRITRDSIHVLFWRGNPVLACVWLVSDALGTEVNERRASGKTVCRRVGDGLPGWDLTTLLTGALERLADPDGDPCAALKADLERYAIPDPRRKQEPAGRTDDCGDAPIAGDAGESASEAPGAGEGL